MKFITRTRNLFVAAILAAAVAPVTGCAVGTAADLANEGAVDEVGAIEQELAVEPGKVLSGLQAVVQIDKMIGSYQKYGKLSISTGEILDKVTQVESDVTALRQMVSNLQDSMAELQGEISVSAARNALATVDAVMAGWVDANESTDPNALARFYSTVYNRTGVYGTIDLATLGQLAAHAQAAIVASGAATTSTARANDLGVYAAGVRLRLTEGFFLIMLASQSQEPSNQAFFPGGAQVVAQNARLATFDSTFLDANDTMNKAIVAKGLPTRASRITECVVGTASVGFVDTAQFPATAPFAKKIPDTIGFYMYAAVVDRLTSECRTFRSSYVAQQQALFGSQTMGELLATETAFANWATPSNGAGAASTIRVEQAFYGSTELTYRDSDVSAYLQSACDHRGTCAYTVKTSELGDIERGATKDFWLTYTCGASTTTKALYLPAEANGQTVTLSCE